ncbi:MAG: PrsW family intramembrane metalloprotease [Nanoarchaeota archaeon]|nr:PrsW family intramembrane metalloprotease [Nanoarchaeota archaeon]
MISSFPFLLAIAPALYLVYYFYQKDRKKPEPKGLIIKIFLLGILSTIPVIIIEMFLGSFENLFKDPLIGILFRSFMIAGLTEESFKFLVVKKFAYNKVEFDEIMDGIIYVIVASLGFACLENILYVYNGGFVVGFFRAFTAVPMHAVTSGLMGFYIGKAKFAKKKNEKYYFFMGLLLAVLVHGLYDFLVFYGSLNNIWLLFLNLPLLIGTYLVLMRMIKKAINLDAKANRH